MLCHLDNLLQLSDRKVPCLGKFLISLGSVKITISTTTYIKIGVLSAVSCNSSLKAIATFDNASLT